MSESALDTQDALVFYGNDGVEAEEFVRSVMRIAKAAGRFRDNDWIIEEVATALAGDALRWYIELDDEIQNDWKLLRRAILQKYPPPSRRTSPDTSITSQVVSGGLPIVPTAAAAASPVASVSFSQEPRNIFRIKILPILGGTASFIGMKDGNVINTLSSLEALTVKHCQQTKELRVINKASNLFPISYTLINSFPSLCMDQGYETGEKLAVRYPDLSITSSIRTLGLVDHRGLSQSGPTDSSRISITAWNVGADNILQPTYPSPVDFYLSNFRDAGEQYQTIRVHLDSSAKGFHSLWGQFLNLELEEA